MTAKATLTKTYRVVNLGAGVGDDVVVNMSEVFTDGTTYNGTVGNFTVVVSGAEATKYLPGKEFEVTLTAKAS